MSFKGIASGGAWLALATFFFSGVGHRVVKSFEIAIE
jgi:hypothetical protein